MKKNNIQIHEGITKVDDSKEFYTPERCYILELYNDENDSSVSIARAKVKPGITTQLHCLLGINERYIIISGSGIVKVGGLAPEVVGPGDVVIIPENSSQQITNNCDQDIIFYCVCTPRFTPDRYRSLE